MKITQNFLVGDVLIRMVLSWISYFLTLEILGQIIGYPTSHTTWMALKKIFVSSIAQVMQLRLAFQITRKGSLSMMEYILKLKMLTDNLATIGELVSESDPVLQLLRGPGADYNSP